MMQLWHATNLQFASPILTPAWAKTDSRYCPRCKNKIVHFSLSWILHSIICKKRANPGFVLNAQFKGYPVRSWHNQLLVALALWWSLILTHTCFRKCKLNDIETNSPCCSGPTEKNTDCQRFVLLKNIILTTFMDQSYWFWQGFI